MRSYVGVWMVDPRNGDWVELKECADEREAENLLRRLRESSSEVEAKIVVGDILRDSVEAKEIAS